MNGRPTLSLAIATNGPAARVHRLLDLLRPHVDEIVLAVDRSGDQRCLEVCAGLADRRLSFDLQGSAARLNGWLRHQCGGDWILQLDDDEVPGAALLEQLPELICGRRPSEIAFARRWLYPDRGSYIAAHPWNIDYQPRLVQNIPGTWSFSGSVHTIARSGGELRRVDLPLYHCDLISTSRSGRLRKALAYEDEAPGLAIDAFPVNAMYLPEALRRVGLTSVPDLDRVLIDRVLDLVSGAPDPPAARRGPVESANFREVDFYNDSRRRGEDHARLSLGRELGPLVAGGLRHVVVEATNLGRDPWPRRPHIEAAVSMVYQWQTPGLGLRGEAALLEDVWPGQTTRALIGVRVPGSVGVHHLRIDVVRGTASAGSLVVEARVESPQPVRAAPTVVLNGGSGASARVLADLERRISRRPAETADRPLPIANARAARSRNGGGARPAPRTGSVTLVVETQTHGEGAAFERLFSVVQAAVSMGRRHGHTDVLVLDNGSDRSVTDRLERDFPGVVRLDVRGLGYDEMKLLAARSTDSEIIAFLDGDCLPESPDWLDIHVRRLHEDGVAASGGRTRYDGGFRAALGTIMDFGFLIPATRRELGCYASNNVAFRREVLLGLPFPDGRMRCRCFAHAQLLLASGNPVEMTPEAAVRHELPPFLWERWRQGYDIVASCWVNPSLPEARWLRYGVAAAPMFFARTVRLDAEALRTSRGELGLAQWQRVLARILLPAMRLIDVTGMLRALVTPGKGRRARPQPALAVAVSEGWSGSVGSSSVQDAVESPVITGS